MKKNLLLTLALCLLAQWSVAQAPKWVEKAKRAVFSVVTYDESDKILNTGNGFLLPKMELLCLIIACLKVRSVPLSLIRRVHKCLWKLLWGQMTCMML